MTESLSETEAETENSSVPPLKWDIVGPTADDDIRRAISRYGLDVVLAAVKRQTKPKLGRKPEKDWPELADLIEADAKDWLAGNNPFNTRSNYSIAKDFADKKKGQSHPATMKRIERKLVKDRKWRTLFAAYRISKTDYPHSDHIRALEALCELELDLGLDWYLKNARSHVADYEAKYGEAPPASLSIRDVENATRVALLTMAELQKKRQKGMFGFSQR